MLQLSRNGLRLQSLTSLDESQGSSNVKVSIQNDGTYTNYSTQLHYGYYVHGFSYTKGIARYENGVFILPREAFEQYGLLNLAVLLVSSDEELMTNQVQFIVQAAPRGDMIIDDIPSAQQQVLQLVQTTLDQYAHTINLNKNEIAVLKSRMDSFTSLQQGSTTGDAELIDGRVGYDGKTYENIGGAIRGQVSQLSDDINNLSSARSYTKNFLPPQSENGYYDPTTGNAVDSSSHKRTPNFIELDLKKVVDGKLYYRLNGSDGVIFDLLCYDKNGNKLSADSANVVSKTFPIPSNTTKIKCWIASTILDIKDICLSYEELDNYVAYEKDLYIPNSQLEYKSKDFLENLIEGYLGNNILPPSTEKGYYSTTDGSKVESSVHNRSVDLINVDPSKTNLFITLIEKTSSIIFISFYDSSKKYLYGDSIINQINKRFPLRNDVAYISVWTNNIEITMEDICVSYVELNEFEQYINGVYIKEENVDINLVNRTKNPPKNKLIYKKVVNFGDSIFGNTRPSSGNDISTYLSKEIGAIVYNCGFGGCCMAKQNLYWDSFSMYKLADAIVSGDFSEQEESATHTEVVPEYFKETVELLKTIDFSKVDYITIAYGTNDFNNNYKLDNSENNLDVNTFAGALRYSIEKILTKYPQIKIFTCTPIFRTWLGSENEVIDDSDTHKNSNNNTLVEFVDKTIEVSNEYHIPYVDNYNLLGFNKLNRLHYFPINDGTHPNLYGNELIAKHMSNEMF